VDLAGGRDALVDARGRDRARRPDVLDPLAAGKVVHQQHAVVSPVRDAQGGRPPDITVAARDEYGHGYSNYE